MNAESVDPTIFEQQFKNLFDEAPFSAAFFRGDGLSIEMANNVSLELWGKDKSILGKPLLEGIPEIRDQEVFNLLTGVYRTGKTYEGKEHVAYLQKNGRLEKIYVNLVYKPIRDAQGNITGVFAYGYDVTEQVVAREELKESFKKLQDSEERYRTLITETPEVGAGLYIGRELRIQYVNDVMLKFWGKDQSIIGKTWWDGLPELRSQSFLKELEEVLTTGKPFIGKEVKAILERKGKLEVNYYNYTYKALKNVDGEIYGIHHMAVDVTDQVISKQKLIESEEDVRNLFEQTPVGIAMFKGRNLIVELVNNVLLEFWGRSREQVIDKPVFEALPELVTQGVEKIARDVFDTGVPFSSPETSLQLWRNEKLETIIVRFGFRPVKDWQGEIIGLLAIANEVTDLVLARQVIEKNEMRLKFLADSMPQVVWIAEGDGTVTYYNKRVLAFAGVKQNDDGTWSWEGIVHPDDIATTAVAWKNAVMLQKPYELEHRIMMSDGSFRWHLSRAYAYETDEGLKWFGTATDVDDQKKLEMNLETLVKERTLELQRSNEELQQFAHVASHDLKEPVRKIRTFAYKLLDEQKTALNERGNNFINKILHASERMNAMINGVLSYASMPDAGVREAIDLKSVIENVKIDLEILIQEKNAVINYSDLPTITGIRELINQLFYNLINNALKFSRADVTPVIEVTIRDVEVLGKIFYQIILADNGIGFGKQHVYEIFTSFVRLNPKDQYEGSGLGLALCKKIVERHGGSITAKSEPGKGSEFIILLPK